MLSLAAVGDLQLGDSATCPGFGFRSRVGEDGLDRALEPVRPHLQADVTFGNLETVLSEHGQDGGKWSSMQMRGCPPYAGALRRSGFTVLNVANNHAVQHGKAAFWETVELLRSAGISVCGLRGDSGWSSRPAVLAVDGRSRVGFLGYSLRPRQYAGTPPPFAEGSPEEILSDVRRIASDSLIVVVSLHWGEEFVSRPSAEEARFARELVGAGATLVLGHHPHVLRPVEHREGAVVAYSLGNFSGDMIWQERLRRGAVLRCRVAAGRVREASVIPVRINDEYETVPDGMRDPVSPAEEPIGALDREAYSEEVSRSLRRQRVAAYWHFIRNLGRAEARFAFQLLRTTLLNKIGASDNASEPVLET